MNDTRDCQAKHCGPGQDLGRIDFEGKHQEDTRQQTEEQPTPNHQAQNKPFKNGDGDDDVEENSGHL